MVNSIYPLLHGASGEISTFPVSGRAIIDQNVELLLPLPWRHGANSPCVCINDFKSSRVCGF
ncbi:MAG: hypothetical protein IKD23_07360, partial [Lentisphaeria bacterium]|nr:hypothetical protein [Lentisphaeria bacterium]